MLTLLSKNNLSSGFYQIPLTPNITIKLSVHFTNIPLDPPLVYFTTHLPMGYKEFPPVFNNNFADIFKKHLENDSITPTYNPME